jgi:hypothetical protein
LRSGAMPRALLIWRANYALNLLAVSSADETPLLNVQTVE